jgi:hypothetical protein
MKFNRRDFLKVGLLSASAMSFSACGRPVEHGIVSQYQMPEYKLLGQSSFWASTCTDLRSDCAVSVKTVENRAIHVIGIASHFFSKGTATSAAVSTLNTLYHPARLSAALGVAEDTTAAAVVAKAVKKSGTNPVFVVDRLCGSVGDAMVEIAQATGGKIWVCDSQQSVRERRILKSVTGRAELPLADLENRDFLVTVGSNFLQDSYAPTRTGWAYGRFRKTPGRLRGKMVSFSSRMNATDANSDIWEPVLPGSEPYVLGALGKLLSDKGKGDFPAWAAVTPEEAAEKTGVLEEDRAKFAETLTKLADRLAEANAPLVVGGFQGVNGGATVYLAHTITKMLNGDVVTFDPDLLIGNEKAPSDIFLSDAEVAAALQGSKAVIVHNVDLVYRFPWLEEAFKAVKSKVVLATMPNDTTELAAKDKGIVIPIRTWMEDWGDLLVNSPDGTWYGLQQPAVSNQIPAALSSLGFLLELADEAKVKLSNKKTLPREFLKRDLDNEQWEDMLVRGGYWEKEPDAIYGHHATEPPPATENSGKPPEGYNVFSGLSPLEPSKLGDVEPDGLTFVVLPTHLGDGQMADRPWMQELPDAMTTVVWDSWIEIGDSVAAQMGVKRHDRISVSIGQAQIKGSAYPSPFIHPKAVGVPSGRGQKIRPHAEISKIGWISEGSNPKTLFDGSTGSGEYYSTATGGASLKKEAGSRLLATFDERVYNLPRHILPE